MVSKVIEFYEIHHYINDISFVFTMLNSVHNRMIQNKKTPKTKA